MSAPPLMDERLAERRRTVQRDGARRRLKWTVGLLVLAATAAGIVWAIQSPYLSVTDIDVSGVVRSDVTTLLASENVVAGRPMVGIEPERVRARLIEDPWVADVEVKRVWPTTISIRVAEHQPAASVRATEGWYLVSAGGSVLDELETPHPDLGQIAIVVETGPGDATSNQRVLGALSFITVLERLEPDLGPVVVREVGVDLVADVAGHLVRLGSFEDMGDKAAAVSAVLATGPAENAVIDVIEPRRPALSGGAADGDRAEATEDREPADE